MLIRRKRRLSIQHTLMDPELVPLYPNDDLTRIKLPPSPTLSPKDNDNDLTSSSTDMIVLGRSRRPFHSRTKKVCTSASLIERLNRILQQTMDTMQSSTTTTLDLHDYKFIPSNSDPLESKPANQSSSFTTTTQSSSSTTTTKKKQRSLLSIETIKKQRSLLSIETIKKQRILTMMIHPPPSPLRIHKMILRSTTITRRKNSNSPHTPSPQTP